MSNMNLPPNTVLTPDKTVQDPSNTEPQVTPATPESGRAEAEAAPQQMPPDTDSGSVAHTPPVKGPRRSTLLGRVIWYIGGVISIVLAFRFVLALLRANPGNPFAHSVYTVSSPLASPFFTLFTYAPHYGASPVEISTLVAIAVYLLAAWGLVKLVTITRTPAR